MLNTDLYLNREKCKDRSNPAHSDLVADPAILERGRVGGEGRGAVKFLKHGDCYDAPADDFSSEKIEYILSTFYADNFKFLYMLCDQNLQNQT